LATFNQENEGNEAAPDDETKTSEQSLADGQRSDTPGNIEEERKGTDSDSTDDEIELPCDVVKTIIAQAPQSILEEGLKERKKSKLTREEPSQVRITKVTQQKFSGPLPPPSLLKDYDAICKGAANRILVLAEKEQEHRHTIENKAIDGAISKDKRGQNYALIVALVTLIGAIFLIARGHSITGSILVGGTLTSLVYIFINGKRDGKTDNEDVEKL